MVISEMRQIEVNISKSKFKITKNKMEYQYDIWDLKYQ